jgi:hypothetical protein
MMTIDYAAAVPVLRKSAEVIEEREWTTQRVENSKGQVCVMGAIGIAVCGNPWLVDLDLSNREGVGVMASLALERYLAADPQPYGYEKSPIGPAYSLTSWNDFQVADGATVAKALRAAADWAEGRAKRDA